MTLKKSNKEIEKYLYIVIPRYLVDTDNEDPFEMECGRLIAQAVHVGSKLKLRLGLDPDKKTTTIILQTNYNDDIRNIGYRLMKDNVHFETFEDSNKEVYNTEDPILTALATYISKKKGKKYFWKYKLYDCKGE